MYHYKVTDTELPPADQELAHWDAHRARELSKQYGCVAIHGPHGWYALRGHGDNIQVLPGCPACHGRGCLQPGTCPDCQPATSDLVLESYLIDARFKDLFASLPSVLARSA